ncbi:hypothetical protein BJ322DRAFT_1171151 [Thelephora terrestris]|uniref:Uncharacterized protein n=1 Tax=Thelephora terrestris TaxID=56493 RepID=A0A9P6HNI7_9AGAM|nr:hypothetical protein BJ322DRAFT_1171151 [Thelephora terrestris]
MGERTVELTGLYGHHQALSVDEVPGDMSYIYAYTSTPDAHIYGNLGPSNQPASRTSEPAIHSRPTPNGYTSLRRDPLPSDGISLGRGIHTHTLLSFGPSGILRFHRLFIPLTLTLRLPPGHPESLATLGPRPQPPGHAERCVRLAVIIPSSVKLRAMADQTVPDTNTLLLHRKPSTTVPKPNDVNLDFGAALKAGTSDKSLTKKGNLGNAVDMPPQGAGCLARHHRATEMNVWKKTKKK